MSKTQEKIFALITVLITVPCFVFYCLTIENHGILNVEPVWALKLIPVEFILAYISEIFLIGPKVPKILFKKLNPKKDNPILIETGYICTTVCLMCPWMSFLATILYKGIIPVLFNDPTFTIQNFFIYFIPNFLQTFVQNFPFALLAQLFFIQPLSRTIFKKICKAK